MGKFSASFVQIFGQVWVSFQPNHSELLGELLSKLWQVFGDLLASVVGHLEPFRRKFYPVFGDLLVSFVGHFEGTSEQFWRKF